MNDKIIINAISKLHFIIVSIVLFVFLILSTSFVVLQNGLNIGNISLSNLQVKQLYIKWDEKLNIIVEEIHIIQKNSKEKVDFKLLDIQNNFKKALLFDDWFQSIVIENITFNDINASFKYVENKNGFLIASSDDFSLNASLFFEKNLLNIKIDKFSDLKRMINVDGDIVLDVIDKLELYSSLNININNEIFLNSFVQADRKKLSYVIKAKKDIIDYRHLIGIVDMPKEVEYWAYEAIRASSIEVQSFYGWLEYSKMNEAFTNLYIKLLGENLTYIYHPKLEPVVTKETEVELKNGKLNIRPKGSSQYGFNLGKSWIEIDFTKEEELLKLFLLFKGKVNKDLLYLLDTFKIKLPFLQNSGVVDTDLTIEIGLRDIGVTAKGIFFTEKANFNYLGLNIDIFNATIYLDNYDVSIDNMHAKYQDIAVTDVDLKYNAKKNEGKLDFRIKDIYFKEIELRLEKTQKPLDITYILSPKGDTIDVKDSKWDYKGYKVALDSLIMPFDIDTLIATIPTTMVKVDSSASAYITGDFLVNPIETNLEVDLLTFNYDSIRLNQSNTTLKVRYDETLRITSSETINIDFNEIDLKLDNTSLEISNDKLKILNSNIGILDLGKLKLNADYGFRNKNANINIEKIILKNKRFGNIYSNNKDIALKLQLSNNMIKIKSSQLGLSYTKKQNFWKASLRDVSRLSKFSPLMQDYNISNGLFEIAHHNSREDLKFYLKTKFPYKIMLTDNIPIEDYKINGSYNSKKNITSFNINNKIDVILDKEISIRAKKTAFNFDEVLRFVKDRKTSDANESLNLSFKAKDSYIYISEDRHIISDAIELNYHDNILKAQLNHKKGEAKFDLKNNNFHLYGKGFNDEFMTSLFSLSKFKDGALSFSMNGSLDEYDGIVYVKETTIAEYKILNNILAFVNTIPALVTFSLPGYSKKGLEVENAYLKFKAKDNIITLSDLSLNSKELDIVGKGLLNFKLNYIDLILNLKTSLGSDISNIPLVGYILLDEEAISTSLEVSGKLSDPDIKSLIVKDIVVAPLNIIKRALLLPIYLFSKEKKK